MKKIISDTLLRPVFSVVCLFMAMAVSAQTSETVTGRIELNEGQVIIESFTIKMTGDTVRLELGDLSIVNGSSPTVHRFSVPAVFAVPVKTTPSRRRVDPNEYAGELKVTVRELSEQGEELFMDIEVRMHRDVMNRRLSYLLIPELTTGDSTATGAGMLVNGWGKDQLYRRRQKFQDIELQQNQPDIKIAVTTYSDTLIRYNLRMPYALWMDDATLDIHQVLGSPAGKEQLYTLSGAAKVKLLPREPYTVEPKINFVQPEREDKSRRMQGQAFLDFQVGRSVLVPNFRRNPEELGKIDAVIGTILEDKDLTLTAITLEGFASPEGSYESNDRLSRARAEALKNYLRDKFSIAENLFAVTNTAEDWEGLKLLVEESSLAEKDRILEIIATVDIFDGRERELMRLAGGRPYRTMLTEMFPDLRRVEYRADFNVKQFTAEQAREVIGRNPQNLSLYELFLLTDVYDPESPETDRLYELMLRQNPDHPVAILNFAGYLLSRNDANGAKRQLDRIANRPEAANNVGVFYLMQGDLDQAETYFRKAIETGLPEARHNLEETQKKREDNRVMERYKNR